MNLHLVRLLLSYVKCEKVNSIDFLPFFIFRSYQENCITHSQTKNEYSCCVLNVV